MKKLIIAGMAVILIFGLKAPARGQKGMMPPYGPQQYWYRNPAVLKELGLNDQQQQSIKAIERSNRERLQQLMVVMRQKQEELEKEYSARELNKESIDKKVEQIALLNADIYRVDAKARLEIQQVLTPDQREKLGKLMAQKKQMPRMPVQEKK